jgi:voltage-gated sodium channel
MDALRTLLESRKFQSFITTVILINAVTLGLETSSSAMSSFGPALLALDAIALIIFCLEIFLKLVVHRFSFFRSGWNVFDFIIVGIALVPAAGPLTVLRALRILRVLRIVSVLPRLRRVVDALLSAIPGMGAIFIVLGIVYYVSAVLATNFFGQSFPQWFGTVGASLYTLFQVMTLESWSMGIVRPVMEVYPLAWVFFVPFIICATFTVLNLFIAVLVSSVQAVHDSELAIEKATEKDEVRHLLLELSSHVGSLREQIEKLSTGAPQARAPDRRHE